MRIAYDCKLGRPACVLLQAALGGDRHVAHRFPAESWLVDLTPDMKVYEVLPGELSELVGRAEQEFGR